MTSLKKWENGESRTICSGDGRMAWCRLGVCHVCVMCRSLLSARLCYGNVAGWRCTWFNELFVTIHVEDIINTDSNK